MAAKSTRNPPQPDTPAVPVMEDRFLKMPQVIELAALSRTMIYRLIRQGKFPKPYKPGGESSRWDEGEVRAWKERVKAERPDA